VKGRLERPGTSSGCRFTWQTLTTAFFHRLGGVRVRSFPDTFRGWCDAALGYIQANVTGTTGGGADIAATFFSALPGWLTALVDAGRANTIPLLAVLAALWYVFLLARRAFAGVPLLPWLLRVGRWLTVLAIMLVVVSAPWFDWMNWVYTYLPNNGPVAMAYFPLNFASALLVLHVALWSQFGATASSSTRRRADATLDYRRRHLQLREARVSTSTASPKRASIRPGGSACSVSAIWRLSKSAAHAPTSSKHISGPNRLDRAIKGVVRLHRHRHAGSRRSRGVRLTRLHHNAPVSIAASP